MPRRYKVVKTKKDQREFTRTATKIKKINIAPLNRRGGICL